MATSRVVISESDRARHLSWLSQFTQTPTASGKEQRVVRGIEKWVAERSDLSLSRDDFGNMTIAFRTVAPGGPRPVYFTAHLDHPAFVVERIIGPGTVELSFRGGVMDEYFVGAGVTLWNDRDEFVYATLDGGAPGPAGPFKHYLAHLDTAATAHIAVGDVGVWKLPKAEVIGEEFHTLACDDLAALAAALSALDVLRAVRPKTADVRVLCTRAEEVGFVGAIGACRLGTIPKEARVIALENSRSFPESPIGGGPIVRVGDRMSVFSPSLTDAIAKRAEEIAGGPASVTASQKQSDLPKWKWQRKLMAGGACEASVFCNAGYEATCVCLPLGNYHNMADLAGVQAGTNTVPPRVGREYIGVKDYEGLVDLLVACGQELADGGNLDARFEKLWNERNFVLG